jgi:hypothetical protein
LAARVFLRDIDFEDETTFVGLTVLLGFEIWVVDPKLSSFPSFVFNAFRGEEVLKFELENRKDAGCDLCFIFIKVGKCFGETPQNNNSGLDSGSTKYF